MEPLVRRILTIPFPTITTLIQSLIPFLPTTIILIRVQPLLRQLKIVKRNPQENIEKEYRDHFPRSKKRNLVHSSFHHQKVPHLPCQAQDSSIPIQLKKINELLSCHQELLKSQDLDLMRVLILVQLWMAIPKISQENSKHESNCVFVIALTL